VHQKILTLLLVSDKTSEKFKGAAKMKNKNLGFCIKFFMAIIYCLPNYCFAWNDKVNKDGVWPSISFENNTLGSNLDNDFRGFLRSGCNMSEPVDKKSIAIPKEILDVGIGQKNGQGALRLEDKVVTVANVSNGFAFDFVFPSKDLSALSTTPPWDQNRILNSKSNIESPIMPFTYSPMDGLSSVIYRYTCSSYMSAALDANASFIAGDVLNALKAERSQNVNVLVVSGVFTSTLARNIAQNDPYTYLLFWEKYRSNAFKVSSAYYLKGFRGTSVVFSKTDGRKSNYTGSISGQASTPLLKAKLAANIGLDETTSFNNTSYVIYIYNTTATADDYFGVAPTPDKIIEVVRDNAVKILSPIPTITGATRFRHYFEVEGIPDSLCQSNAWELDQVSAKINSPSINIIYGKADKEIIANASVPGKCLFGVNFDTDQAVLGNSDVVVNYSFKSTSPVQGKFLSMTSGPINAPTSANPEFIPNQEPTNYLTNQAGSIIKDLRWPIPLVFLDDAANLTLPHVDTSRANKIQLIQQLEFICGDQQKDVKFIGAQFNQQTHQYEITLQANNISLPVDSIERNATQACVVRGVFTIPVLSSNQSSTVTRRINAKVLWPTMKSAS